VHWTWLWEPDSITRAWPMLAARADIKPTKLHDARHTHASLPFRPDVHPKTVRETLGHSTISTTLDICLHVAPRLQEAAARAFDALVNPERGRELMKSILDKSAKTSPLSPKSIFKTGGKSFFGSAYRI